VAKKSSPSRFSERANRELGILIERVDNMNGKVDEIHETMKNLPCSEHTSRLTKIEAKGEVWGLIKLAFVAFISSVVTYFVAKGV